MQQQVSCYFPRHAYKRIFIMQKNNPHTEILSEEWQLKLDQKGLGTQTLRFNSILNGLVVGIISGFALFLATIWLILKGGDIVGPHLALLGQFFIGYQVSISGAFIGFVYGFLSGFIFAYSTSYIYNAIVKRLQN